MSDESRLIGLLNRIDGRAYPAYRDAVGEWDMGGFSLFIDHVQGDPFAAPSRVRVRVQTAIDSEICADPDSRLAAEDWLLRQFGAALKSRSLGSGRSGSVGVLRPGPEVEERSAMRLGPDGVVEARFQLGFPARGRRVLGNNAWVLFDEVLREAVSALKITDGLQGHVASVVRQRGLRRAALAAGLVAFVEDGAILARVSGVDQGPLVGAVPFVSPPSLRVSLFVDGAQIEGMGVRSGVTVIVGGGFHGKSTLLNAIQRGHLDHIPGDGRSGVVAHPDTVKVRAEDGRPVCKVDISAFLGLLPGGRETRPFSTADASGSTSQAAGIIEAVSAGAKVLLIDEDTSATNLLVRDAVMRALIPSDKEPITPFVEQVTGLSADFGVSTIIVVGGVGDYLRVADTVIGMVSYLAEDMTEAAKRLVGNGRGIERRIAKLLLRCPVAGSFTLGRVRARDGRRVSYGEREIDLVGVEQILSVDHAWSVGWALGLLNLQAKAGRNVAECLDALDEVLDVSGVDALCTGRHPVGGMIRPRRHEVAAALNRLRGLKVEVKAR